MSLLNRFFSASRLWKARQRAPDKIGEIERQLGLALAQRSLMAVSFLNPQLDGLGFSGPCLFLESEIMVIDAPFREQHSACRGEAVEVCFSVDYKNTASYFRFNSTLLDYDRGRGFVLAVPSELFPNQRREFVRIMPQISSILHMDVWPLASDVLPPLQYFVDECAGGRNEKEDLVLMDISAAGLRLKRQYCPEEPADCFAQGSYLLCFLKLKSLEGRVLSPASAALPGGGQHLDMWLAGSVRHRLAQAEFSRAVFGVSFMAWAVPGSEKKPPAWSATGEGGQIALLNDWVWRQQLEILTRKNQ